MTGTKQGKRYKQIFRLIWEAGIRTWREKDKQTGMKPKPRKRTEKVEGSLQHLCIIM
jgi:hypothetical protein